MQPVGSVDLTTTLVRWTCAGGHQEHLGDYWHRGSFAFPSSHTRAQFARGSSAIAEQQLGYRCKSACILH